MSVIQRTHLHDLILIKSQKRKWSQCILINMHIVFVSVSGDTSVIRLRNVFSRYTAVDTVMILIHPATDLSQDRRRFLREFTFGIRSYVQDHISTLGNALYQLLDQHGSRFVIMVVCTVSPVVVHGEACFPDHRVAFLIADSFRRDDLLRAYEIAMVRCRITLIQGSSSLSAGFQTVIDDNLRL